MMELSMWLGWRRQGMYIGFWWKNPLSDIHLEDQEAGG